MSETGTNATEQEKLLATFQIGNSLFGLDTNFVQEVLLLKEKTCVYHAPEAVWGIINLRGKIVTVIDLGRKLGLPADPEGSDQRILITPWMGEQVGLLVDGVSDVLSLDPNHLEEIPPNIAENFRQYLTSIYRKEDNLVSILNLEAVLAV